MPRAHTLGARRVFDVMIAGGGSLRPQNGGIIGQSAQEFLQKFRAVPAARRAAGAAAVT